MTLPSGPAPPAHDEQTPSAKEAAGTGRPDIRAPATRPLPHDGWGARSPRLWSARRVPAALVALVTLCVAGVLLYDVIAVRAGHRAGVWRIRLADELATRPVDDLWLLIAAAVAVILGLWLLILALTPGLRRLLPLRAPDGCPDMEAWLDRKGAALLLRDAAMRVPGISGARVRVGRRRVTTRADVRFRDPATVRDELTQALQDQCRRLGVAHTPRVTIRLRHHTR
ncbi:DUF6286 domain-containing protein [Streptomyces sp. NBC_01003]|uniref:DUF6286 domain-containing protein n=1 Tax=Streptomyces sp. NBC_01003 TaxID=2903714 RepID=UPI00386EE2CA|nr:DUF6286 domain-containing protein [Streptomyces sp. NBC_01003]